MDALGKHMNPSRLLKEEFVSNLEGSSMLEIAALFSIMPALIVLRQWSEPKLNGNLCATEAKRKKDDDFPYSTDWKGYTVAFAMDFLYIIVPLLLIFTVLSDWTYLVAVLLIIILAFFILIKREGSKHFSSVQTSLLSYRVSVVVATCLCILAVDFKIFPRRYAKTETYGTSLMDIGVGSFVVANSLVSRQARHAISMTRRSALLSTSPLLLLAFGRLIFTMGVNYQVHAGEYGVHWNFFFTLTVISILTTIINIHPKYCGVLGLLMLIAYQICLQYGLSLYLHSNERSMNIISLNKEGLFSVFGYWAMYLIGVHIGHTVFFGGEVSSTAANACKAHIRVWILSVSFWMTTLILDNHVERVSRRTCNMAYVSLVFALNFQVISILMLSNLVGGQRPLVFEEAYNGNLLGSFLLANILTGMINLLVDTLSISSLAALFIFSMYAFVLSATVGCSGYFGIKIKFW